jgi:mRNA interferase HigB
MRLIALSTLKVFWKSHPDAEQPLLSWHEQVKHADWQTPAEVKAAFGSASILRGGRVVFNIAGNKYRLVAWINHPYRVVYIRFVGTHKQYDQIDAQNI